ncbi:hypothetical protein M422DRAFT_264303 [Sphaerobolus stellatus SS14]|uniref:Uncharacterized protein n=1 Tax=Sphaerobolus stellatus (strain SS14) TaxID=990650 RepID=A0A0C9TTL5_SPHS4|nr:hypothetical protein M422DRAFT_264303 [Sphaerobolus stellatus SS14]
MPRARDDSHTDVQDGTKAQRLRNDDGDMGVEEAPGRDGAASHGGSSGGKVEGVVTVGQWDPWRTADIVRGEKDALTICQRSSHHTQFDRRTIHRTGKAASHVAECYLKMNGGDDGTHSGGQVKKVPKLEPG